MNSKQKLIIALCIISCLPMSLQAMGGINGFDPVKVAEEVNHKNKAIMDHIESCEKQLAEIQQQLRVEKAKPENQQNKGLISTLESQEDKVEQKLNTFQSQYQQTATLLTGFADNVIDDHKSDKTFERERQRELGKHIATEREKGKAAVEKTKEIVNAITNFAKDPKNLASISGAVTLAAVGIAASYYGGKLVFNYADAKLRKPKLIQRTSIKSFSEKLSEFIFGVKKTKNRYDEITLDPELEFKIQEITSSLEDNIATGQGVYHVLLTGAAGTGKTMFSEALAKRLAQKNIRHKGKKVPVNYLMCAGGDFAQFSNGEDIVEFHKIVNYANHADGITILFIDEIDSLLKNRADSRTTDAGTNRTTTFLSLFDKPSHPKIMILGGTNYPDRIDHAALTRFSKKVKFKLPEGNTLKKLFEQYLNSEVINKKISLDSSFTEHQTELINAMQGLAPRTIEDIMKQAYYRVRFKKTTVLTYDMLKSIIDDAQEAEKLAKPVTAPAA